jgi:hypothetical protein
MNPDFSAFLNPKAKKLAHIMKINQHELIIMD